MKHIDAGVLNVAYDDQGPADGIPVFLLHGFPYDVRAYDAVIPMLTARGCRTLTPYLRGYGSTRFLSAKTARSGEQAVLAHDLIALMNALAIPNAVLAGYDWGGRAACIVAALWPQRVRGLVTGSGYNVHNVSAAGEPMAPEDEYRLWYQYYFHSERGRAGLEPGAADVAEGSRLDSRSTELAAGNLTSRSMCWSADVRCRQSRPGPAVRDGPLTAIV